MSKHYVLRNGNQVTQHLALKNHYGEATFIYIFSKLINFFLLKDLYINFNLFANRLYNNVNLIFHEFICKFPKLDLRYKT